MSRLDRIRARSRTIDLAFEVFRKSGYDGAGRLAALISYYSFFSLFPLLLVLVSVVGWLLGGSLGERILESALANFPVLGNDIADNVGQLQGSGWAVLVGFLTAVWAGTKALDSFGFAMHVVWHGPAVRVPSIVTRRLRALLLVAVLGLSLVASVAVSVILGELASLPTLVRPLGYLASVMVNTAVVIGMYRAASGEPRPWRTDLPGGVVAGVGLTAAHLFGSLYVQTVVQGASDTYGVFAVVIGLLSWLNLVALITIWCAELNSVLAARSGARPTPV